MNKKEKSDKEKINDLFSIINNLKSYFESQIQELNKKIINQNDKIENQNKQIELQNKQINELQKKLEENNDCKKHLNTLNIFDDSVIINQNQNYILNLKKWISPDSTCFTTKLLFRKSIDGDSFKEFHRLCDHKGKTLVLIKGEEGFIIGGYTTVDWDTSGKWYKDDKSFLFSLTKAQIFRIKADKDSIRGCIDNGPWFATIGFKPFGKNNLSQGYFYYQKSQNDECFENYNDIIPNEKKNRAFNVIEVEIYQINK